MSETKIAVRYIGPRAIRRDNICKTLTIWTQDKPVAMCSPETAARLFQFPTVWAPDEGQPVERPQTTPDPEPGPDGENAEAVSTDPVTPGEVAYAITNALVDDDFTKAGKPKVAALREIFGQRSLTPKAIEAGWKLHADGE